MTENPPLARYDAARAALAEAKRVDEVLNVRHEAERMKLYARQAQDRGLIADANEIHMRASRKLGRMLREAKAAGQIVAVRPGREPKSDEDKRSEGEHLTRVTLAEVGVDRKLSMIAQKMAEIDDLAFEVRIEAAREKIVSGGAALVNPVKDITTSQKQDRRAEREARLAEKQKALPVRKYGVIYADPEWQFEVYSRDTGLDRSPDNHYPTSSLEDIKARDVASIAADDCVLFLWVTVPHLDQGLEVLKAWGFAYKTHYVWNKDRIGTGYWSRNKHEILLVGTIGNPPAPAAGTQIASVIDAPVGRHSEKPEAFHELIERFFPNLPKIELNARAARPGWDLWGNEAPETADPDSDARDVAEPPNAPVADSAAGAACAAPAPFRSTPETDAVIRAGYAEEPVDLDGIARNLGATKLQVRRRANQLGLGSRDRQKAAASAFATAQHASRAGEP